MLILFLIALACTCWLTDSGAPPSPIQVGVTDVTEASTGAQKTEQQMFGDFRYVDNPKPIETVTGIKESGQARGDLPYNAAL